MICYNNKENRIKEWRKKMHISLELVPYSVEELEKQLINTKANYKAIDTINIPDLSRLDVRGYVGSKISKTYYKKSIPHLRAIDFDVQNMDDIFSYLKEANIEEVLIIGGDIPENRNKKIYHTTSLELISEFKRKMPWVKLYGAIDQYRSSFKNEYTYIKHKIAAGVDGFFTQPFFDMRLASIYSEMLEDIELFLGVSPVTSERSANYWRTKNNVVFPKDFTPTLDWSVNFSKEAIAYSKENNRNIYFMPITIDIDTYLKSVFELF
jgi:methylenetetrahydrofolate reductase (NADPH)